jgi:hypothetical protein
MPTLLGNPNIVFGIPEGVETLWIQFPADATATRVRFRHDDFARGFVKTPMGIKHFILVWNDEKTHLKCVIIQGANYARKFIDGPRQETDREQTDSTAS